MILLTKTRQRSEYLQDVHAPSSPLHGVGWEQSQSHHAAEGRHQGEHHHQDLRLSAATRNQDSGRLHRRLGFLRVTYPTTKNQQMLTQ